MSSSARVMLVEDELIIADSILQNLEKSGYRVTGIASSATEALEMANRTHPDLVLMDIRIRGPADGIQVAETIRDSFRIPIIFLTAHADRETVERAKKAEPFGYVVKPIVHGSLVSAIEIALYKHAMERKLEEHRAWLTSVLHTSAEAIIVTDCEGRIEFLNSAAEELTGIKKKEAGDQRLSEVLASAVTPKEKDLCALLEQAVREARKIAIPRDTQIRTRAGHLAIGGQIAPSLDQSGRLAGCVLTLHDATAQRLEEQQLRQEQKMALVGHFAEGVANDFCSLLDLISDCGSELSNILKAQPPGADTEDLVKIVATIRQSSAIAVTLSQQFLNLAKGSGSRAELVQVKELVCALLPTLRKLAGPEVIVTAHYAPDLGAVFAQRHQMEQLLINLVLNARERLCGKGKMEFVFDNGKEEDRFVRLCLRTEQSGSTDPLWASLVFPFQMDSPPVSLNLVAAIVAAAEGFVRSRPLGENSNEVEILLPRREGASMGGRLQSKNAARTVLTIGLDPTIVNGVRQELEQAGYTVLAAVNTRQALAAAVLHGGDITAVVADSEAATARSRARLKARLGGRASEISLFRMEFEDEPSDDDGWVTLTKPLRAHDLVQAIEVATRNLVVQASSTGG